MTTIRKTNKGVIIEQDAYSAYYNATIAGSRCFKIWISREVWDKVTAKWVDGTYRDMDGNRFRVGPEDLDSYLKLDDLLDNFRDGDLDFIPGVRVLDSHICQ